MGSCPQHLLDAFSRWALEGKPDAAVIDDGLGTTEWPWRELCLRARDCTESMPSEVCEILGMPYASSYARAAKRLLREAGRRTSRAIQASDADGNTYGWTGTQWVRLPGS